jgi:DNA-directed RNA polymerase subunit RPC12/RpoP
MAAATTSRHHFFCGEKAMLAICEDCSKKYNIDESKMKGPRAKFTCYECGHIIVVVKGKTSGEPSPTNAGSLQEPISSKAAS